MLTCLFFNDVIMLRLFRVLPRKTTIFNSVNNSAINKYFGVSGHFSVGNITFSYYDNQRSKISKMYFMKK